VRIASAIKNVQVSYTNGKPRVLTPGFEYQDFPKQGTKQRVELPVVGPIHAAAKIRANQWKLADYNGDGLVDLIVGVGDWDGTTGNPKGVVIHHRGAYLNSFGNAVASVMGPDSVYLWTLPMFHCNGWSFTWTMALLGGTNVCLRRVETAAIFAAIQEHRVTHLCGAPIVLNMMVNAPERERDLIDHPMEAMTGGAAPPAAVIARMEEMGIAVTHLYGLTETYGPTVSCAWHREWDSLPLAERARLKSRVGVRKAIMEEVDVLDPATMQRVPRDGATIGEIMMRGNVVMRGYLKNPRATEESFAGGWYHTGDLGVVHPDAYIQIKDRSKDIIISGGENISSIELEDVLYQHPAVLEAAVVARPDERWGETPCAFVALKPGVQAAEAELIAFCRERLAAFKIPKTVVFGPLPKTATGKVQKYVLRERVRGASDTGQTDSGEMPLS
jgi:fatty-acyl-CoA synthase